MKGRPLTACLLLGFLIAVTSCHAYRPPSSTEWQQLRIQREARLKGPQFERREIMLRAEGDVFSGQFEGVWVGQRHPRAQFRIQLFPDVGSKVLDLAAGPAALTVGRGPETKPYRWRFAAGGEKLERPLSVFGLSLQRYWSGLDPAEVTGLRLVDGAYVLRLATHPSGIVIGAETDRAMRVARWRFQYRGFSWTLEVGPPLRFVADDNTIVIETVKREQLDHLPPTLFEIPISASGP